MATTKYSDLISEVLPLLAADPSDPVTEAAIKRACIEFCNGSWVWQHVPDPLDIEAGVIEYDLDPPTGADISTVVDVTIDGQPGKLRDIAWINSQLPRWRTEPGHVMFATQINTEQLILAPCPAWGVSGGIEMTLALQPALKATGLPRWIATQYLYSLVDGAVGYLMLMPSTDWTDLNMAAIKLKSFQAAISGARADAISALGRAPTRTTPQH